ncbi:MAG: hypothetical protein KDE53_08250 [Caldilineaceae bacterium]|nr:hypothetical protein [Caldilineaceae bacterium]
MSNMRFHTVSFPRVIQLLVFGVLLLTSACTPAEESRWTAVQEATQGGRSTTKEALAGGDFNQFFPQDRDQFDVVYTQEKQGFAEALLRADDQDAATLSVFDTVSNPAAAEKYTASSESIEGYPAIAIGDNGTAILVADRFQVQVRSESAEFSADDRTAWLAAFDLAGLAALP